MSGVAAVFGVVALAAVGLVGAVGAVGYPALQFLAKHAVAGFSAQENGRPRRRVR